MDYMGERGMRGNYLRGAEIVRDILQLLRDRLAQYGKSSQLREYTEDHFLYEALRK